MEESHPEKEEENPLFRKKSLERLNIPDQVDELFIPINTFPFLIYSALAFLFLGLLLWLFLGSIPIIIEGRAIAVSAQGLYSIEAKTKGNIAKLLVKPGDFVQKGQKVAEVEDIQEEIKYQNATARVKKLEEELGQLKKQISLEKQAEKLSISKQIEANKESIKELENTLPRWEEELKSKEKLYQEQLIGLHDLEDTRQILAQNKIAIQTTKATLATLEANLRKVYREQEIKEKERAILQANQEKELHRLSLNYGQISSTESGVVLEVLVNPGNYVQAGTPLIHLEYASKINPPSLFYGFVSLKDGKQIREGLKVEIEPTTVNSEEYGAMLGIVKEISLFAVSKEDMANLIQNDSLINYLMHGEVAVMQMTIEPIKDLNTISGYKWTSKKGPPFKLTTGTVAKIATIAGRTRPVFYFFSLWRIEMLKNALEYFWENGP